MYSYQTAYWPQSNPYFINYRRTPKQPGNVPAGDVRDAVSGNAPRTDMQIAQDVREELEMEPSVRADAIDVQVRDGMATLSGVVDSEGERWLIESAARRIAGIQHLSVLLKVHAADVTPADDDIAHDCERVLRHLKPTADYDIGVMVTNGWVTLSGDVAQGYERRTAETEVSSLLSVHGVNSQVTVRPLPGRNGGTDRLTRYRHALKPGTNEFATEHDRVTWSGILASWAEHRATFHAAWSASGVKRAVDRMRAS